MSYQVIPVGEHTRVEELARRSYGALPGSTLDFCGATLSASGDLPEICLGFKNVTICNCTLSLPSGVNLVVDGPPQGPWGLLLKRVTIIHESAEGDNSAPNCAVVLKSGILHMDTCKLRGCYVWVGPSTTFWGTQVKVHGASFGVLINSIPSRPARDDDSPTNVTLSSCTITAAQFCGIAVDRIKVKCNVRVHKCTVSASRQGDGLAVQSCSNAVTCDILYSEFLGNFGCGIFCGDVSAVHRGSNSASHIVQINLQHCVCAGNAKAGVNFSPFMRSNPLYTAVDCTFEGNGCTGIYVDEDFHVVLKNCVSRCHVHQAGILLPSPGGLQIGERECVLESNKEPGIGYHYGQDVGQQ